MHSRVRSWLDRAYERLLRRDIDDGPDHVAIIMDGNRRYARERGDEATAGHREGSRTTEQVLRWCQDLGVEELTVYAFSTENFDRSREEREHLFDLIESKLREFADAEGVHENEVCIRALGQVDRLPDRVCEAVDYAEGRTETYDRFRLNVAVAYGGRAELLGAARDTLRAVEAGRLDPEDIDVDEIDRRLYARPVRDVDLIVRTGGAERTSNFLPWHANGNEAAVFFCAPYWPEFSKVDFLRAIRTYESREASWRHTRTDRAVALVRAVAGSSLVETREVVGRLREQLPRGGAEELSAELDHKDRTAE
ncbi:polyprenyl diphosphate synthase [Haloplanus pelagicus]|uniref:polyprenyl diphosphate synthase n=1 Tax=Haloplanus pelagicus TaxID=2949995 RepID=UPI002041B4C0|nr:polyprenyl diphosphate synthase [Haloplanus sp. HW8-1]